MKHSIEYSILIEGRSKELLIKEMQAKLAKLDFKLGKDKGAVKERQKISQYIQEIKNFRLEDSVDKCFFN